jgi:chromosome segregation ATPase
MKIGERHMTVTNQDQKVVFNLTQLRAACSQEQYGQLQTSIYQLQMECNELLKAYGENQIVAMEENHQNLIQKRIDLEEESQIVKNAGPYNAQVNEYQRMTHELLAELKQRKDNAPLLSNSLKGDIARYSVKTQQLEQRVSTAQANEQSNLQLIRSMRNDIEQRTNAIRQLRVQIDDAFYYLELARGNNPVPRFSTSTGLPL